jgi:glycosyltransferase involved in cell wall biosynthesis
VDTEEFQPGASAGDGVAFVGGLHWVPNLDALEWFAHEILPPLRAAHRGLPVTWIGSATTDQQRHYRDQFGIEVTGYVDDVRPLMRAAACHIVPLRAGGGTRLKILNSWAMGKPVVTTAVGCEGLEAIDGENVLIRDDSTRFAAAIVDVLKDSALARRVGRQARETVERHYSWDLIGRDVIDLYQEIAHVDAGYLAPAIATYDAG